MASFYKRGDCQWEAEIRRKRFSSLSKILETRQEAKIWALQVKAEMKRGTFISRAEAERTVVNIVRRTGNLLAPLSGKPEHLTDR